MKKHPFMQVDFHSTVKLTPLDRKKLSRWFGIASQVLEELFKEKKFVHPSWMGKTIRVSVLLCGEAKIRQLNRDYRQKDKVTDVLSFPTFETMRTKRPKEAFVTDEIFLGDLAICHQKTIKQAREYDISYFDEFIHLYMHGLIHLVGYDHEVSLKEEELQQRWEERALELFTKLKKRKGSG